jgi:DNA-binding transcriptional ArsR family regulator
MRRDVFQAIADPTRREIINLIANRSMNVNALAENFTISRAAISLQVKILQECGLVTITEKGRERICEAHLGPLKEVAGWLDQYSQHWEERFSRLDKLLLTMDDKPKSSKLKA